MKAVAIGCEKDIENAIRQCAFIETQEREDWKAQILQGRGEAIVGLLLPFLPHLTSMMTLQPPQGMFMRMLRRIAEFHKPPHKHAPQALTKLASIYTAPLYSRSDVMPANDFEYISYFALLPSMRVIFGRHFYANVRSYHQSFRWSFDPGISAVTEILIERSTVDGESIINLLRGIRALEKFKFSSAGYAAPSPVYQPRKIIRGLEQYAKLSLSHLHLTGCRICLSTVEADDLEYDLRGFEKLKQLHLDHTLLNRCDRPCLAPSSKMCDQGCNCWPQRLVDVLHQKGHARSQ